MNENQNLLKEAETLERELDSTPEWLDFGQILNAAHEAVYRKPTFPFQTANYTKSSKMFRRSAFLSAAALLLLALTIGLFHGTSPFGNDLSEYDPELDWEDGELDLELFDEQLERVVVEDPSLELEYAILEDSLSEWVGESEEELF